MATLKKKILAIQLKIAKQSDKSYHENGLCYLFSCVYEKILKGELNKIGNKDIQYPTNETVETKKVFLATLMTKERIKLTMIMTSQVQMKHPRRTYLQKSLNHQPTPLQRSQRRPHEREKTLLKTVKKDLHKSIKEHNQSLLK